MFCLTAYGNNRTYKLFDNGDSGYCIIVSSKASESELYASRELQYWIHEVSGVTLPIKDVGEGIENKRIIVGLNQDSKRRCPRIIEFPEETDSYAYFSVDGDILIYGGSERGTMYGVFSFLENELGVHWYTKDCTIIKKRNKYIFTILSKTASPAIQMRNVFYHGKFDADWMAHNKISQTSAFPPSWPINLHGNEYIFYGSHTFANFVPVEKFFRIHPEYYSLYNGKRISEYTQLCLTNPQTLQLCIEGMLQMIKEHPDYYSYELSQFDCGRPCQCENCTNLKEKYGSESGLLLWFVNQVADVVKEEYPNKFIHTLAYQHTESAPKRIKPKDNVIICLCGIRNCAIHSFSDCPINADFNKALSEWAKLTDKLFVVNYVASYKQYCIPVPNFNVLSKDIKACSDLHCMGMREFGTNMAPVGDFADLRAYVMAKLLWDPYLNVDELVDDFIKIYYGRSASYIRQYYDLLQSSVTKSTHLKNSDDFNNAIYSEELITRSLSILKHATIVADSEEYRNRVESIRLGMSFVYCMRYPRKAKKDGTYDFVKRVFDRGNIDLIGEGGSIITKADFYQYMNK